MSDDDLGGTIGGVIGAILGFSLGTMGVAYLYMLGFLYGLHYDYVTVSSVFMTMGLVTALILVAQSFAIARTVGQKVAIVVVWLGFYPFLISSALTVFEHFQHPMISSAFSVVEAYRRIANAPLAMLAAAIGGAVPMARGVIGGIERSPLLVNLVGAVIAGVVARFLPGRRAATA